MNSISYDKYIEIVEKLHCNYSSLIRWQVEGIVRDILADADIVVEPPPILPGVTAGKWYPVEETGDTYLIRGYDDIAYSIGNQADAKVMAASKELAEAAGKCIKEIEKIGAPGELLCKISNTLRPALEKARGKRI